MAIFSVILSLLLGCLYFLNLSECHPHHEKDKHSDLPKLILLSFDGFRWDYLDIVKNLGVKTPNFDRMMLEGASVEGGLKNIFITKTFPNHFSIVTGMYEDMHGVVANSFFDPVFNESFQLSSKEAKWWDGKSGTPVVPIWKLNEACECKDCECARKSGVIFWPGSDAETLQPTYYFKYNTSTPFDQLVSTLVELFMREEHPINLGLLYIHEPDSRGHEFGPLSNEVALMVEELDNILGFLLSQLDENDLLNSTNLIVTSDHGMLASPNIIYLSDHVDTTLFKTYSSTPVFHIYPLPGQESAVYEGLKKVPNINVYLKDEIPEEYHYRNNRRVPPILLSAHVQYEVCITREQCYHQKGNHGYNNSLPSMHPIFVARGPSFKRNFKLHSEVESIDLYPLIASLLQLTPPPTDGKFERVKSLLLTHSSSSTEQYLFVIVTSVILVVALLFSLCACYHHVNYFGRRKLVVASGLQDAIVFKNTDGRKSQKRLLEVKVDEEEEDDDF